MHRGRLVFGGAVLLLGLLVAGLWWIPGMLDWNRYRDGIAALASRQLGRPVHIGGGVALQVLPQPILTASDITVDPGGEGSGGGSGGGVSLEAKALRLRVGLVSLLTGQVDARELTLQGADLHLPWPPTPGALSQRPPSWLMELQAKVEDSRLAVGDVVFTGIDATLSTDPDTGTLSAAGTGRAGGRSWRFTARLARPGRDGSAGLDVSLDGLDLLRDTGGTFSGQLGSDGALSGRVAGRGPDLSQLMPAPPLAWRGDGRLTAAGGLAVADELALEIGGAPARGAVALRVQPQARLDVALAAGRLDLDAWLPALLSRRSGTLRSGIPTGIDLSAEAATLGGGTLRRLRGGLDLVRGGALTLRDVSAVLPGEAELSLSGTIQGGGTPRLEGPVHLEAPDLRTTVQWLSRMLPASGVTLQAGVLPAGTLRSADLRATVTADLVAAGQVAVSGLQGRVDGSTVAGALSVHGGARPGLTAALTLGTVVLNPWIPELGALLMPEAAEASLAALRAWDADIKLQATAASWNGVPLGAVALELQTEVSRVVLRRLDAQPMGMRASLSGQVAEGGRLSDGRFEVAASDLGALRPAFDGLPPSIRAWSPLFRGAGSLLVLAAGPADALTARLTLEVGDLRLESQPIVSLPARRWSGPITLHHPGAPRLLETLGFGGTAAWLGDGSLSLVGQATMTPGRLAVDGATFSAGALRGTGQGWIEGRRVAGQVSLETLPLPLVYARSPDPLPLSWLRTWQGALRVEAAQILVGLTPAVTAASADVALQDGVLRLDRVAGRVAGGTLGGEIVLDGRGSPPVLSVQGSGHALELAGAVFGSPVDLVAGHVDAAVELMAAGYSPAAMLATLGGHASVQVHDGVAAGFDLVAAGAALDVGDPGLAMDEARRAVLAGHTEFMTLDAPLTVQRGLVSLDATLIIAAGAAKLAGSVDLQSGTEELRLVLRPSHAGPPVDGDGPGLGLRLSGAAGAPVRTPELTGLARWLADRPNP